MPTKRLYELCRELGVDSQTVINRCRAEGVVVRNHMHEVASELEADIRRWLRDSLPPDEGEGYGVSR